MPNGPRRKQPPLVMKQTAKPLGSWDFGVDAYSLHTDAGTEDFGGTEAPMVKFSGEAQVSHAPNQDTYAYPTPERGPKPAEISGSFQDEMVRGAISDLNQNPGQLFGYHHQEGESTMDSLGTTEAAKVHGAMLTGMAAMHTMQSHGRELQASDDRSEHSERMVQHLEQSMGKQFKPREMENLVTFMHESPAYPREMVETEPFAGEVVPDQEVRQAQRFVRRAIHKPKYGPERPASTQPQLPGMEGY